MGNLETREADGQEGKLHISERQPEIPYWMMRNILTEEEVHNWIENFRQGNEGKPMNKKRISVMVSGVFDMLHAGHLVFLMKVDEILKYKPVIDEFGRGSILVRVAGDEFARKFKGDDRPVMPEIDRAFVVAGCRVVSKVFVDRSVIDPADKEANVRRLTEIGPDMMALETGDPNLDLKLEAANKAGIKCFIVTPPKIESTTEIISRLRRL